MLWHSFFLVMFYMGWVIDLLQAVDFVKPPRPGGMALQLPALPSVGGSSDSLETKPAMNSQVDAKPIASGLVLPPLPTLSNKASGVVGSVAPLPFKKDPVVNQELPALPKPENPASVKADISLVMPPVTNPGLDVKDSKENPKDLLQSASLPSTEASAIPPSPVASVEAKMDLSAQEEIPDFNADVLSKVNMYSSKINDFIRQAKDVSVSLDQEYDKAEASLQVFAKSNSDRIGMFEYFYQQLKTYVTSQSSTENTNKKFKDLLQNLDYSIREFYQDLTTMGNLQRELESAFKEVLSLIKVKNESLDKLLDNENDSSTLLSELYSGAAHSDAQRNDIYKKLDGLVSGSETLLQTMQSTSTSFKSKLELAVGKIKNIEDVLAGLKTKKDLLEASLKAIAEAKQQGITEKEDALLQRLKDRAIKTKVYRNPSLKKLVQEVNDSIVESDSLTADVADEKKAVETFIDRVILGLRDFSTRAVIFIRKIINALMLKPASEIDKGSGEMNGRAKDVSSGIKNDSGMSMAPGTVAGPSSAGAPASPAPKPLSTMPALSLPPINISSSSTMPTMGMPPSAAVGPGASAVPSGGSVSASLAPKPLGTMPALSLPPVAAGSSSFLPMGVQSAAPVVNSAGTPAPTEQTEQANKSDFSDLAWGALREVLSGFEKLISALWHYILEVYSNFRK